METPRRKAMALKSELAYLGLTMALVWLLSDLALGYVLNQVLPSMERISPYREKPGLHAKIAHYRKHAAEYNVIYVGDSRTYCGIAPDQLDKALGTRSVNLSTFANWFPTQYPSLQELLRDAPKGTVVVWSIGHQNFERLFDQVNLVYPIGLGTVSQYRSWGYSWPAIRENVFSGLPGLRPWVRRNEVRERFDQLFAKTLPTGSTLASPRSDPIAPDSGEAAQQLAAWRSNPEVVHVEPIYADGAMTSFSAYMRAGNYERVELDPGFFRRMQRDSASTMQPLAGDRFVPAPEYWNIFLGIVDLFAAHDVQLIVNEFEEAPYNYSIPENRRAYRAFMREVRDFFVARGIPYVRVDFDQLQDADYFDYNHLNSQGIEKYSAMLATQLEPLLAARPLRAVQ